MAWEGNQEISVYLTLLKPDPHPWTGDLPTADARLFLTSSQISNRSISRYAIGQIRTDCSLRHWATGQILEATLVNCHSAE
jgi:hypothetical protein